MIKGICKYKITLCPCPKPDKIKLLDTYTMDIVSSNGSREKGKYIVYKVKKNSEGIMEVYLEKQFLV